MPAHSPYERILARSYDSVYRRLRDNSGDIEFYSQLASEQGGPVLELGCGTGRTLLPIAKLGLDSVGLDISAEMLAVLKEKNPPSNLRAVRGKMEAFDFGQERFRLITAPFRAVQHLLDVESQLQTLANVRRHLSSDGVFAFDVFGPKLDRLAVEEGAESAGTTFSHDGDEMTRFETVRCDLSSQTITVTFRFEGGPAELSGRTEVKMRWYYRYELEHLLARAGFAQVQFYRDFKRTPWSAGREIVVVARA